MQATRIFFDPTGRRARLLLRAILLILAIPSIIVGLFLYDLWSGIPVDPSGLAAEFRRIDPGDAAAPPPPVYDDTDATIAPLQPKLATSHGPMTVAFYANWDDNSLPALRKHIGQIDWIIPDWLFLQGPQMQLVHEIDDNVMRLMRHAPRAPYLVPLLTNSSDDGWDGPGLARLLASEPLRRQRILAIRRLLQEKGFQGVAVQFAEVPPGAENDLSAFMSELSADLHSNGLWLVSVLPLAAPAPGDARLGALSDYVVLQELAQPAATGKPAPLLRTDAIETALKDRLQTIPAEKIVLTVANYGRDWTLPKAGPASVIDLGFRDVMLLAHDHQAKPQFDAASGTPVLRYSQGDTAHEVWFLDAVTTENTLQRLRDIPLGGYALWRLGSEDPTVWQALPTAGAFETGADRFAEMPMAQDIFLTGSGDLLRVTTAPVDGARLIRHDPVSAVPQLTESYTTVPVPLTVNRYGDTPGAVSLTFDDGPDPRWTPAILDILSKAGVKATFFITGENAAFAPDLVQRIIDEGHELGNHTFTHPNMGASSDIASVLEINGTQRLIEATSGRRMRMFRAPYVGDSEPASLDEVRPLLLAQERGLYVVGLRADSHDWKKVSPETIVASVLREVGTPARQKSQTILLHDAGGDRSATVAALPAVINALKDRGFRIVPASALAGETSASIMPEVPKWTVSRLIASLFFTAMRLTAETLSVLFVGAIGLGIARLALICGLGVIQMRRDRRQPPPPAAQGLISVLIPAYNEEKVIEQCLMRLQRSCGVQIEVLVIDDGSTDQTAARVARLAQNDPRISLFSITNGGKANALNFGLRRCRGEVVIALDADTLFHTDTAARLARWFADPAVVAVAGNAKVGNRINFLTRCQALEYITAQNLERRAYAALGCITVVPGAVGAWRRSAVLAAGGFPDDTLAEDQDLTLTLQRRDGRVIYDAGAIADTEAPDTLRGLTRQRFRWCFGTMQCLWKHRHTMLTGRPRMIGWFALPQILLFQIVFSLIAPIIDLSLILRLLAYARDYVQHAGDVDTDALRLTLLFFGLFLLVEILAGLIAFAMERRENWRLLWLILPQRFGYRQLLCLIAARALLVAAAGQLVGWGHLERKASVTASAE